MPFLNLFWVLFWLDLPLQGILEPPCVTHRWEHHSAWIWGQLLQDWSSGDWAYLIKLELGGSIVHRKWDKNGKKRLEIVEFVLFYKRKYCTTILPDFYDAPSKRSKIAKFVLFYMQKYCTTILHSFKPGSLQKVAILKRSKMAISNQSKWQFWSGQNMTMTMMTSIVQPILTCFYLLYAFKLILPV